MWYGHPALQHFPVDKLGGQDARATLRRNRSFDFSDKLMRGALGLSCIQSVCRGGSQTRPRSNVNHAGRHKASPYKLFCGRNFIGCAFQEVIVPGKVAKITVLYIGGPPEFVRLFRIHDQHRIYPKAAKALIQLF